MSWAGEATLLRHLPPAGRLLVAACRLGEADLRAGLAWPDSELLALCDAAGLQRCAAARLGAFVAFLLREAGGGQGLPGLRAPGCHRIGGPEPILAACIADAGPSDGKAGAGLYDGTSAFRSVRPTSGSPASGPAAARRLVAGWWPPRRRVQGMALLQLAAEDLMAWAARTG